MESSDAGEPVQLPITGELDLHPFQPSELGGLVPEYLRCWQEAAANRSGVRESSSPPHG